MSDGKIGLMSKDFCNDPYAIYKTLREAEGPFWFSHEGSTRGMWLFTRYDDVVAILKETRITKDVNCRRPREQLTAYDRNLLAIDPPDHTRIRSLANRAFTSERVKHLEPRIGQLVDALIASARPQGGMDFMADFALPLPAIVIAELLGVPAEDREVFHEWSNRIITGPDATSPNVREFEEATRALEEYLINLIHLRQEQPQDDLISSLIQVREAQNKLSEAELVALCMLLLIAGHETTVNMFGNGLFALLSHPDQLTLLKSDLTLLPSAIEEMLRFESPVQRATFRATTEDVRIGNATIEKGQQVSAILGAANRDPAQFPQPDVFDIRRRPNRHLAFGLGIHACLGPALARLEARVGFTRILAQLPHLRLENAAPDWNSSTTALRGLRSLRVQF